MSMIVNRRDLDFLLYEVLGLGALLQAPRYQGHDRASVAAVLDLAQRIAEAAFAPCAAKLDATEPRLKDGRVALIPEVAVALRAHAEAGFFAAGFPAELGGLQLPQVVTLLAGGLFSCANPGIASYPFLTIAAANLIAAHGSPEQKARFLPPMLQGRWFGTMCLSEPQAGSSLADIATRAIPTPDGRYRIQGAKMWISGGEQEISENIVHLVLAKIPGGPPGVKGISLFIVPKRRLDDRGAPGEGNNVTLVGLNHKMGHRGTTNTLLNFGEAGDCLGELVGEPHQGLACMFHMMNEARIGVGYGAAMSGLAGFLYSLDYARSRPQGRRPQDKDPATPPVMIVEHTDVKRLLMAQKAYVEGAIGLLAHCAFLLDLQQVTEDPKARARLSRLLDLLTPIAKSWPSEFCLEANKHAIQVLGGAGYTRDHPVERFYRDNRLNAIHEGTHGVQAIDLLGRKVAVAEGAALSDFIGDTERTAEQALHTPDLWRHAAELRRAVSVLKTTTERVLAHPGAERRLANATLYLDAFGHVAIAWIWLRQALAAVDGQARGDGADTAFYQGKLAACRFFYRHELPKVFAQLAVVARLDDTCLTTTPDQFIGC
ncbi:MAG: acyl-CoA dehydrogenase [Phenylobacterium sp.]|uniref:acyl-CoA dehydrogenase n=1 Tax=Phenylobacterium sp. TaxID=1871053 RepID=UPI0027363D22|nr:acyl-CoA dehydrogenase [Phenylobacterium sp.]MDP3746683.1 acyl-CoA dehydrogenase [Phenylobacterium sp.]